MWVAIVLFLLCLGGLAAWVVLLWDLFQQSNTSARQSSTTIDVIAEEQKQRSASADPNDTVYVPVTVDASSAAYFPMGTSTPMFMPLSSHENSSTTLTTTEEGWETVLCTVENQEVVYVWKGFPSLQKLSWARASTFDVQMETLQDLVGPAGFGTNMWTSTTFLVVQSDQHVHRWVLQGTSWRILDTQSYADTSSCVRPVVLMSDGTVYWVDPCAPGTIQVWPVTSTEEMHTTLEPWLGHNVLQLFTIDDNLLVSYDVRTIVLDATTLVEKWQVPHPTQSVTHIESSGWYVLADIQHERVGMYDSRSGQLISHCDVPGAKYTDSHSAPSGFGFSVAYVDSLSALAVGTPFQDGLQGTVEVGLVFVYDVDPVTGDCTPMRILQCPESTQTSGGHFGMYVQGDRKGWWIYQQETSGLLHFFPHDA
jgi:hypothetical protein